MVVTVDAPLGADGVKDVGLTVAIGVRQTRVLGALGKIERATLVEHTQGLMEIGSELGPLDLGDVGLVSTFADPDVATAGGDGDLLAGQ